MSDGGAYPAEGDLIGPYRVVRRLGGGGMGVVLEADDATLDRRVAVKVIAPHLAQDLDFRARFTREARALASLDSPHVVHVYAHGEVDGRLYIATQLVPDGDLGRLLERGGALPLRVALDLVAQVASGLADAHAAGLVHRDIKPANVLLRRRDDVLAAYLSDFGIARQVRGEHTHPRGTGTIGTPSYMAPELHTGGRAGEASDVYALGCLLWATLTGRPPYFGTSDYEIASGHLERPVPQLPGDGALVGEVNRVLRTAMAKDPAQRYAAATALRDDLRRASALPDVAGVVAASSAPSSGRRVALVSAGVAALLLLAGGIALGVTRGGDDADKQSPPATSSSPTTRTTAAPTGDLARATASLARALAAQGVMTAAQARCTAERWIAEAGLQAMVEAGFFDEDYAYVDRDRSAMTPQIEEAARSAAAACVTAR